MPEEIWKSVSEIKDQLNIELEDLGKDYQISNLGNFRIVDKSGEVEEGHITISESQATVTVDKKQLLLHRLVAMLFIENDDPKEKTVVIYLNGDHTDNSASNLAWVSVSERNERRYINQRSTKNIRCKNDGKIFASATSAALYYGIPVDIIKYSISTNTKCFTLAFEYCKDVDGENALYLSTRKAKSLSNMLTDIAELRNHFIEVKL